jgi:hypothetical protein
VSALIVRRRMAASLGVGAVGLGIGAALIAFPGVAAADPSSPMVPGTAAVDPFSLLTPDAAQPSSGLDIAISINGTTLFDVGNATATSGTGDIAIAIGNDADASATGGIFDSALAVGNSTTFNGVTGHTVATAAGGNFDSASAIGTDSVAYAGIGNGDSAIVLGNLGSAAAEDGDDNLAAILSTNIEGDGAGAGGDLDVHGQEIPGNNDIALVVGEGSGANSGSDLLTAGNSDLAAVFGDMLAAAEYGVNNMVDIVP